MPAPVLAVDRAHPQPGVIAEALAVLRRGGLIIFPTDTVYGLGCDASNEQALTRLYRAKGRPAHMPLIVLLADVEELGRYAQGVPPCARRAAEQFWPGPLTIILPVRPGFSPILTAGGSTLGLRIPEDATARALAAAVSLASTSANRSGQPAPGTAEEARMELGEAVDLVLDGGPLAGDPSTVLDCSTSPPLIRRAGPVSRERIEAVIGRVEVAAGAEAKTG